MSERLAARLRDLKVDDLDKMELAAPKKTEDVNSVDLSNTAVPSTLPFSPAPASHTGDTMAMLSAPIGKRIKGLERSSRPIFNSGSAPLVHREGQHRLPGKARFGKSAGKRYYTARRTTGVNPLALYHAPEQVQKESAKPKFENGSDPVQDDAGGSAAQASQQAQSNFNMWGAFPHGRDSGARVTHRDVNFRGSLSKNCERPPISRSANFFDEGGQDHREQGHGSGDEDIEMSGF
ncbi:hypothetical protein DL771_006584 [Monosporascus sp. 5C6A]|nr:hypothetical protein DL771_006584 [Monosporascus sp. 5C6A]